MQKRGRSKTVHRSERRPDRTAHEMNDYGKAHQAAYKLPTEVEFRKELPRPLLGKITAQRIAR